jgi:hypothetical protein
MELSLTFIEGNLTVTIILGMLALVSVVLLQAKRCSSTVNSDNQEVVKTDKTNRLGIAVRGVYRWFIFPVIAGFFLMLTLAGHTNGLRSDR